jgi:hypothetical protein
MSEEKTFTTTTSNWSDSIEGILESIAQSCVGYKWMHIAEARRNESLYNVLMYTSIFIGPLSGILSAISDSNDALQILVTIFSFLSGVISATIKFSEFGEKTTQYKNSAAKYAALESNVRRQLSLSRDDRVNAGNYLDWISKAFDDLFTISPLISEKIYTDWSNYAKTNKIEIPKELCRILVSKNVETVKIPKKEGRPTLPETEDYSDRKMKYELNRLFGSR